MRRLTFLLLCLFIGIGVATAQTMKITGNVISSEDQQPVIGAAVVVKGTTIGTVTDFEGNFSLDVPRDAKMIFISYVGLKTKEVPVASVINVVLDSDSKALDEVVVTAMGLTREKKALGYALQEVKSDELTKAGQQSLATSLSGKIAGVQITSQGGQVGASQNIVVRGNSSFGNNQPLIVVDGVPIANDNAKGATVNLGSGLNDINPEDIESISVLKGGSAALYGMRAGNGVILVTTKRGSAGKMSVTYNGYMSISSIANQLEVMDRDQFLANGGNDRGYDTNWMDEITRTPFSHSHNLALTGGTTDFNYRASVSYRNNQGIALKSGFNEMIARFSANQNLFDKKIQIAYDATYRRFDREGENSSYDDYSAFKHAYYYNPTAPVYDETGTIDAGGYYALDIQGYSNPVAYIMQRDRRTKGGLFQGSARVTWNILEGLRAQAFGSLKYSDINKGTYTSREVFNTSSFGSASRSFNTRFNKTLETTIDYVKSFGEHHLVVLGGYTYEHNYRESFGMNNSNFDSDVYSYYNLGAGSNLINNPSQSMMDGSVSQDNLVSFFGRVNYNWGNRYLLSASVRREGSTRLGADYKWGTFPAVSVGWSIGNEAFMESASWINDLKLRLGYGVTGNMPSDNYLSLSMMGVVGRFYDHTSKQWINAYGPTQNQNPDLKWERKGEWNLGVDFAALNNRLNVTVDLYTRKVSDLLYKYKVPTPPYQYSSMLANVGDATSKGLEFSVSGTPVQNKNFSWTSSINFSFNTNKLDKLSNETFQTDWIETGYLSDGDLGGMNSTPLIRLVPGGKVGDFYLPVFEGFTEDGKWKFKDVDGSGDFTYNEDREIVGNAQPDFIAGWTNEFKYRDFDLSFTFRAVVGNDVYNVSRMALENRNVAGKEKNMLTSVMDIPLQDAAQASSYYLEDGSFVKLDNITLGYNVPVKKLGFMQNLRLYLTGQNLFTITGYKGIDPEVDMVGLDNMGIERTRYYPASRSFILGLNVTF